MHGKQSEPDPFEAIRRILKSFAEQQRRVAESGILKSFAEQQRKLAEQQRRLNESGILKGFAEQQRKLAEQQRRPAPSLGRVLEGLWQGIRRWIDERWAEFETEHPEHPHPVLYLVAAFPRALGLPLYQAVKLRDDDTLLLEALEPVFSDTEFLAEVKAALSGASIGEVAREHLETGFDWLAKREYVKAYPPFYNGLEAAFVSLARAGGVVDGKNRFVSGGLRCEFGAFTLNDSTISGSRGNGINCILGEVTLNNSTISRNTASVNGGGIFSREEEDVVTLNGSSSVSQNSASGDGGGIYDTGSVRLNDSSSISRNTASGEGGGIYRAKGYSRLGEVTYEPGWTGTVSRNIPDNIFSE